MRKVKTYQDIRFGEKIRNLMNKRQLTLAEIAKETGYAISTVSTWKRGRLPRNQKAVRLLARALKVDVIYLTQEEGIDDIFSNSIQKKNSNKEYEILEYTKLLIAKALEFDDGLESMQAVMHNIFGNPPSDDFFLPKKLERDSFLPTDTLSFQEKNR